MTQFAINTFNMLHRYTCVKKHKLDHNPNLSRLYKNVIGRVHKHNFEAIIIPYIVLKLILFFVVEATQKKFSELDLDVSEEI